MIKPNWNIFKARFDENPQSNFEWFCYSLFCREFKKEKGVFRFKNQSAIETNPVEQSGKVIGWQAKYYDTPLSSHKAELIKTIEKAKRIYPKIAKLLLYTNQEWGQTHEGKSPQGLLDTEKRADELEIELEWRTASYFESPFVTTENEIISKHFFRLDKSIFDQIVAQQGHTENILDDIETSVIFDEQDIEIDREDILKELKSNLHKVIILSGVGGVGKTAVIKKLVEQYKEKIPVYIFKATELELRNINELLTDFNFQDFVDAHKDDSEKIVVIDSAEKLLFLRNLDPVKEFLRILINNKWKIIFTTRNDYLEVLNTEFSEIHKIIPINLKISNLSPEELDSISDQFDFSLPKDEKLTELIRNPFYLNKYLKFYVKGEEVNYTHFKEKLWREIVTKSMPAREQCFLKIALERADQGQFFINPSCESWILDEELKIDGILGYEAPHGYYITHDIYEEWALEKIIETEFIKRESNEDFFSKLGQSLPMRRSFRNWMSEKLLMESDSIKDFIEDVVKDAKIEPFWKDEIVVSILLSDYAEYFFDVCKVDLLGNDQELLKRLTFLIRIACKEVDGDFFSNLGFKKVNLFSLEHVLTKPKGRGWKSLIKFVFVNLDQIGISNIYFILPIIYDWNSKNKKGETVRYASLIALQYYQWLIQEDRFYSRDDTQNHLLNTIVYGVAEIENELKNILEDIVENKWENHRDPYYDLSKIILTKMESIQVSQVLPGHVLRLADLFWYSPPKREVSYSYSGSGVDKYFNIKETLSEYFPASAYQTPTFWLLQSSLQETIDFIIQFTNKTVEAYASSDLDKGQVEEIEFIVEDSDPVKHYISNRLWCTYRGSQVSPHILESMHMALEKFFLEWGENSKPEALESWLLYLVKKSRSASISAVVTSIVLAFPDKTFNVAKVLFKTKDLFFYDTNRWGLEQTHKSSLSILGGVNYRHKIYEYEREKACEDEHRKLGLEQLCLKYQMFRTDDVSEEEAEKRQKVIWEILDEHYDQLPEKSKQTGADKTWRLYLARMDSRKMSPTTEKVDEGIAIQFNPEVDPELLEYSEKSIQKNSEPMKYISLKLWAELKMSNEENYKKYEKYENDPKLALKEIKEIISKLTGEEDSDASGIQYSEDETFILMNASIPRNVCSVLVKYHLEEMTKEEQTFCKDVVIKSASSSLRPGYRYQIRDGSQSAISVLPILFEKFSEEKETIKTILLFSLFEEFNADVWGNTSFNAFAIWAIHELWKTNFEDAQSLLFGYLLLKPKYEEFQGKLRKENYKKDIYGRSEDKEIDKFLSENEKIISNILENKVSIGDLGDIKELDLRFLKTAFLIIPPKTENAEHKEIVKEIVPVFAERLLSSDRDEKIDYGVRHDFLKKLSYFVLSSPEAEIEGYLKPFLDGFNSSEGIADMLQEFVLAEDRLDTYDNFWKIWALFKNKVIGICKKGDHTWYADKILRTYLFAQVTWNETATDWHTLKDANKRFFKEMSQKTGHCPSALYAISKLLNDVGSPYLNDGISWVSYMLKNNLGLLDAELLNNTIYYLESLTRKYIYNNREVLRRENKLKKEVLVVLDFLIENGSVVGYMLRESIL